MPMIFKAIRDAARKRVARPVAGIPHFITLLNAVFGFLAITKALDGNVAASAKLILVAALLDGCDGRLARALGSTSCFGLELDSLCDAVSFCLAPAVLLYAWFFHSLGYAGVIVVAMYLCAGLFRLAKFNVTSKKQNVFFSGLPTPLAAIMLSGFGLHEAWIIKSRLAFLLDDGIFSVVVLFISWLMVSKVKFPAFKKGLMLSSATVIPVFALVTSFVAGLIFGYPPLFVSLLAYVASGLLVYSTRRIATHFPSSKF